VVDLTPRDAIKAISVLPIRCRRWLDRVVHCDCAVIWMTDVRNRNSSAGQQSQSQFALQVDSIAPQMSQTNAKQTASMARDTNLVIGEFQRQCRRARRTLVRLRGFQRPPPPPQREVTRGSRYEKGNGARNSNVQSQYRRLTVDG